MYKMATHIFSIIIISAIFSSCIGQSKSDTKLAVVENQSVGEGITYMDPGAKLIFHDSSNNYWFGSEKGLYKYDGKGLQFFTSKVGLISNKIFGVQEDKLGNIYFDTPAGVSQFDGIQFKKLKVVEDHSEKNIWKLEPDDLWFRIGWDRKGPYRFDGKNLYHLAFPKSSIEDEFYAKYPNVSYNPYSIYSMFKDSKGNLWFGTSDLGIYRYDGNQISWMHEEHLGTTPEGGAFGIRSIMEDKDGYFWICNPKYKYKILSENVDENERLAMLKYDVEKGIVNPNNEVQYFMSMLTDDIGNLWMVNADGVWRYNGKELVHFYVKYGGRNISPTSVDKDNLGVLWFGTKKDGLYKYNGKIFEKFSIN
jgi:ligand-binding sensor domain-containing protein